MDSTFPSISTFLNNFHVGSEWKFTGWVLFYEFSSLSIQNWMDLLTLYFNIWFSLARDNGRDDNYLEEKMMNEENLMLGIKWKKYLKIVILKAESLGEKKKQNTTVSLVNVMTAVGPRRPSFGQLTKPFQDPSKQMEMEKLQPNIP